MIVPAPKSRLQTCVLRHAESYQDGAAANTGLETKLAVLLGRAGVKTVVLEKHADFLRDFRGDTVHPSTLMVMQELGLIEDFLKLPHSEIRALSAEISGTAVKIGDFAHIRAPCKFVALMPQWDFLNFL